MKFTYYLMAMLFLISTGISAQNSQGPVDSGMMQGPTYVPSIAQQLQDGTFKYAENDGSLCL